MAIDLTESGLETSVSLEGAPARQIREVPFYILALGDYGNGGNPLPVAERAPIEIDRDNFDEVMNRLCPVISIPEMGEISFRSMDDFHPDGLFENLPVFTHLRDLRRRLKDSDSYNSAAREARRLFGLAGEEISVNTQSQQPTAEGGLLDAILSGNRGEKPPSGISSELGRLVSDLVRPHLVAIDENEQQSLLSATDASISGIMRGLLHLKDFRRLEAAWRGLFFLCRRAATSSDLKIFLLDVSKNELSAELRSAESLSDTRLYKVLLSEAAEVIGGVPYSLIIGDYSFSPDIDDIATLMRIGKIAQAAGAPFVSHIRPEMLGITSFGENPDPKTWQPDAESSAAKLWNALRLTPEANSIGMTAPRMIGRLPYGAETDPTERFAFEEFDGLPAHDDYLWLNGCYAAATLLAAGFAAYGWEMLRALPQDIDGLPVHFYKQNGEAFHKPCAEILMTDLSVRTLTDNGFMPLISYKSTDRVRLGRYQTIANPPTPLISRRN